MGAAGYVYYGQTQRALAAKEAELQTQRNLLNAFEMREAEQQKTIDALQNNLQKTTESLNKLSTRNAEIEAEAQRYLAIFARHNLAKLAAAKPGLIETRINKGTSDVFRTIEKDSAFIDSIDD
jgi:chromosome segregation ATPase